MTTGQRTKGISLAKGPIALIGSGLLIYGITAVIFGGHSFAQHAPDGTVHGNIWIGLEVNGWSSVLFSAAGLLLLLGSPLHWGAKGMSLIVGLALAAAALVALVKGRGVLGIFAANGVTELVWGAAGAVLILGSLLPRVGVRTNQRPDLSSVRSSAEREPSTVQPDSAVALTDPVDSERQPANDAPPNRPLPLPESQQAAAATASGRRATTQAITAMRALRRRQPRHSSSALVIAPERPPRTPTPSAKDKRKVPT